ncbi:MAG: hypothetical protein ORN98_09205, partial [Alphaproteobacteria bacterium]|nr:hypothetical protein [Alphaproteobacteria bacterium]
MAGNKAKKPVYFWDSGIVIQWFKVVPENGRTESDVNIIRDMILEAENDKIILLVSALWRVEILPSNYKDEQYSSLEYAFSGQHFTESPITVTILDLAQKLRNESLIRNKKNDGKKLSTTDAIQLASAIIYKVDILYSYDSDLLAYNNFNPDLLSHTNFILKVKQPAAIDGKL